MDNKENKTQQIKTLSSETDSGSGSNFPGEKRSALPVRIGYLYLAIPMYLFIIGWLKLPLALLMCAILTGGLCFAWVHAPEIDISFFTKKNAGKLICAALMIIFWVYLSGIGAFVFQNEDHHWRNTILHELVDRKWPVVYYDTQGVTDGPVAMIYYIMTWLPAALVGKLLGFEAAHISLYIWCTVGVMLCVLLLMSHTKKLALWIVLVFILFSGLDIIGDFIVNNSPEFRWFSDKHIEYWSFYYQFSSMTTQLFWVFNQAIPAWLIMMLLLVQKDNRSVIFIYSFSFLACTLPAVGMMPLLAVIGIRRIAASIDKTSSFKINFRNIAAEALTFENTFCGLSVTLLSYLYLKVNHHTENGFYMADMKNSFWYYLAFIFWEAVIYYIVIFKYHKKDPLYYASLLSLIIIPMIKCGTGVDFCMRASIPGIIVLISMIVDTLIRSKACKDRLVFVPTVILLVFGSMTAYHEFSRTIKNSVLALQDPTIQIYAEEEDPAENEYPPNFFGECQDSIFFKYLAK